MGSNNKDSDLKNKASALLGAAFLMATSAIGPGFLTQTAAFTEQYRADFAFVILFSILLALGAQMNVWRVIGISGLRGQDIANKVLPGLGYFVAILVALGGLAFNIGNVGGAALGLNALLGINTDFAALVCGIIGILIFLSKDAGPVMDKFTKILGVLMIIIVGYVTLTTKPPVGEALLRGVSPTEPGVLLFPIITLLGGTVGGYITFSGGHRLLDAGISGKDNLDQIKKSSVTGILIATIMRILLFLAILGVVSKGAALDPANPAASAFQHGAGNIGYRFFGIVLWAAGITSVIGAAFTSVSFLKTLNAFIEKNEKYIICGFIAASTLIMVLVGSPAKLLILAGSLNGLILPVTLGTMLMASRRKDIVGDYHHPTWLLVFGVMIVLVAGYSGILSLRNMANLIPR